MVVSNTASLYYQLLGLDAQKKIVEQTIIKRKQLLEASAALKQAGMLTKTALKQTEALMYNAESSLISLILKLKSARILLDYCWQKSLERGAWNFRRTADSYRFSYWSSLPAFG
ncbi:TolC family protein [Flavobacterium aquicola]|uniref:TolC family protein n=1 Tax=Flavobacterium aquicola TaxID=1682742 RepID=UPI000E26086D|nr:TolC family protein [Flavobacterium aquicola]